MSEIAIRVDRLAKKYRLGQSLPYRRLTETLTELAAAPFRAVRRKNSPASLGGGSPTEDSNASFWALQDVSFEIARGDVVGIIGRNGAGKSTLLKILSRITEPTKGDVWLHGRVGSLLEVGTGFHPELSGRENIFLNGAILGMKRWEISRKFDEIVAFSEVERFLDTPVKHFSSGMYMRLAFAVAAHLEPEILLIDEVLAVGDIAFQKKCLGKMEEVAKGGRTVLFVSHNMNAIEELCDSAILLESGQVRLVSRDVRTAIKSHLLGGTTAAKSDWRNPNNLHFHRNFQPTRFFIGDEHGVPLAMPIRNDTAAFVYIEGNVQENDLAFNVGYALYTGEGQLLYWSLTTDSPQNSWPRIDCGQLIVRSQIPQRFLNDGDYRLEMNASLHFREWLIEPGKNAPAIELAIQGGLSDSPYWMLRRLGILAPVIPWSRVDAIPVRS